MAITHRRTVLKLTPSSRLVMQAHLPLDEVDDEEEWCREDLLLRKDDF